MDRIYAIGDVHGCIDPLRRLMDEIDIDLERDTLVFLGDYIDRGPHSADVVDYIIDLKDRCPNLICLKGNHEEMLERYLTEFDKFTYLINGGRTTLESYMARETTGGFPIPESHLEFFRSLRLYHETDHYIFVHAGLKDNVPLSMQGPDELLWIRRRFIQSGHDFGKRVIFGHTPFSDPLVEPNKIGIDTGAVYGNRLTCLKLPEIRFFSV